MAYEYNKVSINTSGFTLFDDKGVMLRLGYLDNSLSLNFGYPEEVNGKRTYPQGNRVPIVLTMERACALFESIVKEKILPQVENFKSGSSEYQDYNGGVSTNQAKTSALDIAIRDGELYLRYMKEIDENRQTDKVYEFHFQKTFLLEEYTPETGDFKPGTVEGYFLMFAKYLESAAYFGSNGSTHSFRVANKYTMDKIFDYLQGICNKLGISIDKGNSGFQRPAPAQGGFNVSPAVEEELPFDKGVPTSMVESLDGMLS